MLKQNVKRVVEAKKKHIKDQEEHDNIDFMDKINVIIVYLLQYLHNIINKKKTTG